MIRKRLQWKYLNRSEKERISFSIPEVKILKYGFSVLKMRLATHSHSGSRRAHLVTTTQCGFEIASTVHPE